MKSGALNLLVFAALAVAAVTACGDVGDAPLGGPYGGSTNQTDPNSGDNGDSGSSNDNADSGDNNNDPDSGTTQGKDSGTQQADAGNTSKDAGQQQVDSGQQQQTAPTWTQIFNDYLASNKEGRCASCHSQGNSASSLYSWLKGKGYINGTSSTLVSTSKSCLSWYTGNMPPSGPSDSQAVSDMNAWAAAGAQNN